ncbi:MAG: aminotransferase class V-fold PLP-dependent enzyme [Candidatus Gastranaerophilales bacterium]|nr:aminotransferase class V-fold PLP-dependent enzyme [Candidatus Gastranaerophilales bacterium]
MEKTTVSFKTAYAPLVERLSDYKKNPSIGFHIPGHNRGLAVNQQFKELIGQDAFLVDTTDEFDNLGTLHPSSGAIKEAMDMAALCYGSKKTFFVTSGSTVSNLAIAFGSIMPGDEIIAARNSHRSVLTGMILTGAIPIWLYPKKNEDWAIYGAIEPLELEKKLEENKNVKLVWVTNPTYEGVLSDMKSIIDICHKRGIPLVADEAHGSIWNFNDRLPVSALKLGADAVVHSLHKTGGAMTQSSLLHIGKNSLLDENRIEHALKLLHTTSPSILLLAGLDAARANLESGIGKNLTDNAIENAKFFREKASAIPRVSILEGNVDVTKIFLKIKGLSGKRLESVLELDFNIEIESASDEGILILSNIGNTLSEFEYLLFAINKIANSNYPDLAHLEDVKFMPLTAVNAVMTPREAYFSKKVRVKKEDSIGRISAEVIALCPPGISVLLPGEIISKEHLPYLSDYSEIEVIER